MQFPSISSCILLLLILTTLHFIPSLSQEKCHPDDKNTLLQIKKQFGNPIQLSSWDPTTDCCNRTWEGVECDTDTQTFHVINLFLMNLDLPKPVPIPPSITNLPFLFILSLSGIPNLVGNIPPSITKLTKLQNLYISQTNISGEIPNSLSQIKSLFSIDFSDNKLTGHLPETLSSLPNLGAIAFEGNQLTGPIPESYGLFSKNMTTMLLSRNRLSGKIPTSFANLDLGFVDFSRNRLEGDASMLFGINKILERVLLRQNSLSFDIGKIGLPKDLNYLDLRNNKIYGTIPEGLTKLKHFHKFNVSYNRLCGPIPQGGFFQRFDEGCYVHNKCLCGSPLPPCKT